ncbi:MAG: putative Ig domain family [Thermoleophilia bacterium]|nr:putative Ig domain family [Thermoleophilia bacterium]
MLPPLVAVLLLFMAAPHGARGALTLDTTSCSGSGLGFGTAVGPTSRVTAADCTIGFGNDTGAVQVRLYQGDGAGAAMTGIADYAPGAQDWTTGASTFGACLRAVSGSPTTSWTVPGDAACDVGNADPWNPVAATSGASGSVVAELATGTYTAALRFGVRTGATQTAGAYSAPLVVEVLQPTPPAPANTALPVISGTATAGQVLTTTDGTWTGSPGSYTYQWRRCNAAGASCVDIAGASASTRTLVAADVDATLRVVVTATNGSGSTPATSVQTAGIAGIAPTAGTAAVSGTATSGQVLTASAGGSWTPGTPAGTTTYAWRRCNAAGAACATIAGQTASTYTLTSLDVDATVRAVITSTNTCTTGCGPASATSPQTALVAGVAPTAGTLTAAGVAGKGQTLTAAPVGWTSGSPTATDTYQWRRCDAAGASCVDIVGATAVSYVVAAADLDATIRVVMTRANSCTSGCGTVSLTSPQTAVVTAIVNVVDATTVINGTIIGTVLPAGTQAGDLLVVVVTTRDGSSQNIQEFGSTDFTKYRQSNNSNRVAIAIFYRVVTGGESPSYQFNWGTSRGATATIMRVTGADPALPIGGYSEAFGTSAAQTAPSIPGTDPRSLLIATFAVRFPTSSYTPPAGMTEVLDQQTADITTEVDTQQWLAGGATGTRQATGYNDDWVAQMVWINPV